MKHTILIMALFSSTCALAFGGSSFGGEDWFERKFSGVDGFGAIFGGEGKPDIDFVDCGSCAYAHPNTGVCTAKDPNATYDKNTKTCPCKSGYGKKDGVCVKDDKDCGSCAYKNAAGVCVPYAANATYEEGFNCRCNEGYTSTSGTFDVGADDECLPCPEGYKWDQNTRTCPCPYGFNLSTKFGEEDAMCYDNCSNATLNSYIDAATTPCETVKGNEGRCTGVAVSISLYPYAVGDEVSPYEGTTSCKSCADYDKSCYTSCEFKTVPEGSMSASAYQLEVEFKPDGTECSEEGIQGWCAKGICTQNPCTGFVANTCTTACTVKEGVATYAYNDGATCTTTDNKVGLCQAGLCVVSVGGNDDPKECTQNADCPSGKICTEKSICESVSGDCARSSDCFGRFGENYCAIEAELVNGEYKNYVGYCAPIGEVVTGAQTGWISSNMAATISVTPFGSMESVEINPMTWWSARNWCEANNKTLVKAEDFNCSNGVQGECFCLNKGTTCYPSLSDLQTCDEIDGYDCSLGEQEKQCREEKIFLTTVSRKYLVDFAKLIPNVDDDISDTVLFYEVYHWSDTLKGVDIDDDMPAALMLSGHYSEGINCDQFGYDFSDSELLFAQYGVGKKGIYFDSLQDEEGPILPKSIHALCK